MSRIDDGHSTLIEFASNPAVKFYEKEVTPPGVDGGDAIDTTTMRNVKWRTFTPRKLKTLTNSSATVAYDPAVYPQILALINANQLITITFADGSSLDFYGFLKTFTPGPAVEGEQPTAEIEIVPTNKNASGVETDPVYLSDASNG